jgi:isoquinoline 1-oxidoreductase alpha subunit
MIEQAYFDINGVKHFLRDIPDKNIPLLWFLREVLGLYGTKYGCGIGLCGVCTVLVDGEARRSCQLTVAAVSGSKITTIEGLSTNPLHPVQKSWLANGVSQCGYCQPGQIMSAVALLNKIPHPTDQDINNAMQNNLCRCGTYQRIRKAIHEAAAMLNRDKGMKP